ncbi:MAG: hypothetical protein WDO72_12545 [Pseudomonadota bacterium]
MAVKLPSGRQIRLISGPAFLATKFEAFRNRGKGDLLASHDLEDILNVVSGRTELIEEVVTAPAELRRYLEEQCRKLLAMLDFDHYLPGIIQDDTNEGKSRLVAARLRAISGADV